MQRDPNQLVETDREHLLVDLLDKVVVERWSIKLQNLSFQTVMSYRNGVVHFVLMKKVYTDKAQNKTKIFDPNL